MWFVLRCFAILIAKPVFCGEREPSPASGRSVGTAEKCAIVEQKQPAANNFALPLSRQRRKLIAHTFSGGFVRHMQMILRCMSAERQTSFRAHMAANVGADIQRLAEKNHHWQLWNRDLLSCHPLESVRWGVTRGCRRLTLSGEIETAGANL